MKLSEVIAKLEAIQKVANRSGISDPEVHAFRGQLDGPYAFEIVLAETWESDSMASGQSPELVEFPCVLIEVSD